MNHFLKPLISWEWRKKNLGTFVALTLYLALFGWLWGLPYLDFQLWYSGAVVFVVLWGVVSTRQDSMDFILTRPISRKQFFWSRCFLGLLFLNSMLLIPMLLFHLEIAPSLWGMFLSSQAIFGQTLGHWDWWVPLFANLIFFFFYAWNVRRCCMNAGMDWLDLLLPLPILMAVGFLSAAMNYFFKRWEWETFPGPESEGPFFFFTVASIFTAIEFFRGKKAFLHADLRKGGA